MQILTVTTVLGLAAGLAMAAPVKVADREAQFFGKVTLDVGN